MDWNATLYERRHAFVWRGGEDLIALLGPQAGERVLDVGCGTGHLTAQLATSGALVTGLDSSPQMVEQARASAPQASFVVADICEFEPAEPFDAVFSNAALHWVKPPERAAARMFGALRPGGRMVAELGGTGNVASLVDAVSAVLGGAPQSPWYFPSVGEYSAVLEAAGFEVVYALLFERSTRLEGGQAGLGEWLEMFGGGLLQGAGAARGEVVAAVAERLRPRLFDASSNEWVVDYRRLRIAARRPF